MEAINLSYVNWDTFKELNAKCQSFLKVRIEKVLDKDFCTVIIDGRTEKQKISDIIRGVADQKLKVTNPSVLKNWTGFNAADRNITERQNFISDIKEFSKNKPTYFFKIGEEVHYGHWIHPKVVEILEDGLGYKLRGETKSRNITTGGKEKISTSEIYAEWHQIRPLNESTESLVRNENLPVLNYSQRTMDSLLTNIYNFGVDFEPKYQRGLVWEQKDKDLLIDSIFNGVDIGKFVFIRRPYGSYGSPSLEILDGKQRLHTIQEFYENRFPYKGKYFNDLSYKDQSYFRNYNISYADIKGDISDKQKYEIFIRLNTGGRQIDHKQIEYVEFLLARES